MKQQIVGFVGRSATRRCKESQNVRKAFQPWSQRRAGGGFADAAGRVAGAGSISLEPGNRCRSVESADGSATGKLLSNQIDDFRRAHRGDRSGGSVQARPGKRARGNSRHRSRDRDDKEFGPVDIGAGGSARRYLQRRLGFRSARAVAGERRHRRHHGQWAVALLHRSRRQDSADEHSFPRRRLS